MKFELTSSWISKLENHLFLILSKKLSQLSEAIATIESDFFFNSATVQWKTLAQGGNFEEKIREFPRFLCKLPNFSANSGFSERNFFREFCRRNSANYLRAWISMLVQFFSCHTGTFTLDQECTVSSLNWDLNFNLINGIEWYDVID